MFYPPAILVNTMGLWFTALNTQLSCWTSQRTKISLCAHCIHITLLNRICCCVSCVVALTRPGETQLTETDDSDNNPYHNPNEVRKFTIQRNLLKINEVELGSGNFGCVKRGVLQTDKYIRLLMLDSCWLLPAHAEQVARKNVNDSM